MFFKLKQKGKTIGKRKMKTEQQFLKKSKNAKLF